MSKKQNSRLLLPNGCSCSQLSINPKNWKQAKKIAGPWMISYRFYDPTQPKPLQVHLKAMNKFQDITERKIAVEGLIETTLQLLRSGWNPFYKTVISRKIEKYDIEPDTFFLDALKRVVDRLKLTPANKRHFVGYIIPSIEKAAIHLGLNMLLISEVKRRHIIFILDHIREVNKRFSDYTFNRFRADLSTLFNELLEIEAVETNIIRDIKKKPVEHRVREVLTNEQRKFINELLKEKYPEFHRFLHIFYHSGARLTELFALKVQDVDLKGQQYKATILKGQKSRAVWKPIKNLALPYWTEVLEGADPDWYVFSRGLKPGVNAIRPDQVTKRWYRLIKCKEFEINGKKGQKITADWYSLKHLNTTEMVDHLDEAAAAELNAHTSTAMVVNIYDTKQKQRQAEKIRKVNNPFA